MRPALTRGVCSCARPLPVRGSQVLNGVVLKFTEPADARPPPPKGVRWRFYVFKGESLEETLHLHKQSAYLVGGTWWRVPL